MLSAQDEARSIVDGFHARGNIGLTQLEVDIAEALAARDEKLAVALEALELSVKDDDNKTRFCRCCDEGDEAAECECFDFMDTTTRALAARRAALERLKERG